MAEFTIPFEGKAGTIELPALIEGPTKATVGIVLAHGAGGDMHAKGFADVATALATGGVRVVRFQFPYRASGKGAPDRMPTLVSAWSTVFAAARLKAKAVTRWYIGGKSLGGRAASMFAAEFAGSPECPARGLVYLGYPLHAPGKEDAPRTEHLWDLNLPMLFLQGTSDPFAKVDLLKPVLKKLGKRADVVWIERGDHSFKVPKSTGLSASDVTATLATAIVDWMQP